VPDSIVPFSISSEVIKILIYTIPSIAIIWYLLHRNRKIERCYVKPGKKDLFGGFIILPVLLITGFMMSFFASITTTPSMLVIISTPSGIAEWIILCFSCICLAYLEESYFRFYLLSNKDEMNLSTPIALAFSAVLFGLCHINAGLWAFLNAVICGFFLGLMFLWYKCFHGIAIAHALYNITAFVLNAAG
jgi:membrane protease YdiL (CAAX protease family)